LKREDQHRQHQENDAAHVGADSVHVILSNSPYAKRGLGRHCLPKNPFLSTNASYTT
jgi:hypothetical protein